jgi:hypothetical protein
MPRLPQHAGTARAAVPQATIPMAEPGAYRRRWLVLAMGLSPCFVVWYLHLLTWRALLVAAGVGGALAALAAAGTRGDPGAAPHWGCGSGYPIGAPGSYVKMHPPTPPDLTQHGRRPC